MAKARKDRCPLGQTPFEADAFLASSGRKPPKRLLASSAGGDKDAIFRIKSHHILLINASLFAKQWKLNVFLAT